MIHAAGILLQSPEGRVLLIQRSDKGDMAGYWGIPGGKIEDGETAAKAAARETLEETGYRVGDPGSVLCTRVSEDVHFTTFFKKVEDEFLPKLNDEHTAFAWVRPEDALVDSPVIGAGSGVPMAATAPAPGRVQ